MKNMILFILNVKELNIMFNPNEILCKIIIIVNSRHNDSTLDVHVTT